MSLGCCRGKTPGGARPLRLPLQRKPFQQIVQLQLRRLPPVEDRLDDAPARAASAAGPGWLGRVQYPSPARSSSVAYTPSSEHLPPPERPRQRLTIALSTRGRGAQARHPASPPTSARRASGTSSGCGPDDRLAIGRDRRPLSCRCPPAALHLQHQPGEPVRPQPDLNAVHAHARPARPAAARSAPARPGRAVPQRVELRKRPPRLILGDVVLLGPRGAPRPTMISG